MDEVNVKHIDEEKNTLSRHTKPGKTIEQRRKEQKYTTNKQTKSAAKKLSTTFINI